ncbi:nucleotide-diphospho-sugar transferase, partial [Mucor mucedo]|uniref:nucleotide-diphospho-sugar transferase n=1 Tax=Mucor mucedo TaxID=29922 RepID=UPI0022206199
IDELFDYPEFTAVVDIGGVLNTGVFVAEPSMKTYLDIMDTYESSPSYNKGDQGFLNYYFNQSVHHLPGNYNLMVKFTHFSTLASSFITRNTVKVLHFTSETKPWNFYFLHHKEWRENYDGYLFGLWTRALRQMRHQLTTGGLWKNDYGQENTIWKNKGRVQEICDRTLPRTYGRYYPKTSQFTVILNLRNSDISIKYLEKLLRMYTSSKKVARILIDGNVIKAEDGKRITLNTAYFRSLHLSKSVNIVASKKFKSINNRFNPMRGITTHAVFLVDGNVSLGPTRETKLINFFKFT